MKTQTLSILSVLPRTLVLALALAFGAVGSARAQSSAFTYQGRLDSAGQPASGNFDLRLTLYSAQAGGGPLPGTARTNANVAVSNGLFTTTMDFGAPIFDGGPRWLEIGVRSNGVGGAFTILAPRQPISPTPYAINAASFSGLVADSQLSPNVVRSDLQQVFSQTVFMTNRQNMIAGSGGGLTNLDAGGISQGTLPNARLSSDVARRAGGNAFSGDQSFTNGQVGIGMAPTTYPLSVKGSGGDSGYVRLQDSDGTNRWHLAGHLNGLNFVETGVADFRLFFAPGGNVGVGTSTPATKLHVNGTATATAFAGNGSALSFNSGLNLPTAFGPDANFVGTTGNSISFGHFGVSEDFIGYKNNTFYFKDSPGGGDAAQPNVVVGGELTAVAVNITSDRNAKEQFQPVNGREVLEKVSALPISEWQYKTQAGRHIGPMAQDFHAAFGTGQDDRHITTVDADGVALAAIQGLNEKLVEAVRDRDRRIGDLERAVTQLQTVVGRLAEMQKGASK